jgi:hypothetical protein
MEYAHLLWKSPAYHGHFSAALGLQEREKQRAALLEKQTQKLQAELAHAQSEAHREDMAVAQSAAAAAPRAARVWKW